MRVTPLLTSLLAFASFGNVYQSATHSQPVTPSTAIVDTGYSSTQQNSSFFKPLSLQERKINQYSGTIQEIKALEETVSDLSDAELKAMTAELKKTLAKSLGVTVADLPSIDPFKNKDKIQKALDEILPEAFAVAHEACIRTLNIERLHDVQLLGGIALHDGNIIEMKTGEGKTLTAVLPAYLNALMGQGVHIQTANNYLAQRDAEEISPVFKALGMTVGVITENSADKKAAYEKDITYAPPSEMIFDYLRDHQAVHKNQRGFFFAIVDEADKLMIDEAQTPHIISTPLEITSNVIEDYRKGAKLVQKLLPDVHYEVDLKHRTVWLTDKGLERIEELRPGLLAGKSMSQKNAIWQALKAKALFERDKDYVVDSNGKVHILNAHTGRLDIGKQWNDGLHLAIEVKEELTNPKIQITPLSQTTATLDYPHFFKMYPKLSGMTGTAATSRAEFNSIYNLPVLQIPTNNPFIRRTLPDILCKTKEIKFNLVTQEIQNIHENGYGMEGLQPDREKGKGRPILIVTGSIEDSIKLAEKMEKVGIPYQLLTAKENEKEAEIIAEAGRIGAVTIATNIAGRGTDIKLGGDPKLLTKKRLESLGITPSNTSAKKYQQLWEDNFPIVEREVQQEREYIKRLGGLYIIGTERSQIRRDDNQTDGRGGRQGDPGDVRRFISIKDELIQQSSLLPQLEKRLQGTSYMKTDQSTQKIIRKIQIQSETEAFYNRKELLKYQDVLDKYRKIVYDHRDKLINMGNEDDQDKYENLVRGMATRLLTEAIKLFGGSYQRLDALSEATNNNDIASFQKIIDPRDELPDDLIQAYFWLNKETDLSTKLGDTENTNQLLIRLRDNITTQAMQAWKTEKVDFYRSQCISVLDGYWQAYLNKVSELDDQLMFYHLTGREPFILYKDDAHKLFQKMQLLVAANTLQALSLY